MANDIELLVSIDEGNLDEESFLVEGKWRSPARCFIEQTATYRKTYCHEAWSPLNYGNASLLVHFLLPTSESKKKIAIITTENTNGPVDYKNSPNSNCRAA